MSHQNAITSKSALYRLVGVITIGKTKLPVVSFGYPESLKMEPEFRESMGSNITGHEYAVLDISVLHEKTNHIQWKVLEQAPEPNSNADEAAQLRLFVDVPIEFREKMVGTHLFSETAIEQNGFLVAITVEDRTILCFYDLIHVDRDTESERIYRLAGHLKKHAVGAAVPLLRTIERLKSQAEPQRKIEIPDTELGIIYQSLFGDLLSLSTK